MTELDEIVEEESGMITNVFDVGAVIARSDMYKAWVAPDLYPYERQPVLQNWHPEDLVAYCGGEYAKASYNH